MIVRIILVVPVALLVWWFCYRLVRPDEHNWILWIMTSEASQTSKVVWGLIAFAGTVAIAGCMALFARRSVWAFCSVIVGAYLFANFIGAGFKSSGVEMSLHAFTTLTLGMASSFPLVFSSLIAGKQIDIVGDDK